MTRLGAVVLVLAVLTPTLAAEAQQAGKPWRIGVLSVTSPPAPSAPPSPLQSAFLHGLRQLGYVDGRNIAIAYRWGEGKSERLSDLAAELVTLRVSVIFGSSVRAGLAAKRATSTIPIVFVTLGDPVADGLVSSLAHPGGNVTGVAGGGGEFVAKRLQMLKEIAPETTRVGVLWNPRNPGNARALKVLDDAARRLGVQLHPQQVAEPAGLSHAFTAMTKEQVGGLVVIADPTFAQHHKLIVDFAARNRLPAIYAERQAVAAGGLMSYQTNLADLHRRAATYVDKILKGANPVNLPVELSTQYELVINLKTAKALGLTIPQSLLLLANEVIE
jgi:putative ABC transport system substrate-binding protein